MNRTILAASAMSLTSIFAPGAWGQTAPPSPALGPAVEQITVTATHRTQNLQRTAIAVTAVSAAKLESAGVIQVRDLSKTTAGLSVAPSGAGAQIYLNGVGTFSTDTYSNSPVALNLDGIYLSLPAMANGIFYDLSRVEVLAGPQGTLYGKNATAGAINLITNAPGRYTGGYVSQEIGNYGLFKTTGAYNAQLSDQLTARVAGEFLNRDGYYSDKVGRTGGEGVRVQLNYKPNDDISLTLGADYQHATGEEEPLVVLGANKSNPWEGPTTALSNAPIIAARTPGAPNGIGLPPFFSELLPSITSNAFGLRNDNAGVREDLEWNLGWSQLTLLGSYRHLNTLFTNDPGFAATQTAEGHQGTVELRLASPNDDKSLKWQTGLYYFTNNSAQTVTAFQGFVLPTNDFSDRDQSAAAFGETTYSVLPRLRVTAGVRLTTETEVQSGNALDVYTQAAHSNFISYLESLGLPPSLAGVIAKSALAPVAYSISNAATFRNVSLKGGVEYDVAPNSLAYATFTTGYKSGGVNPDLDTKLVPNLFEPERIEAYEIGSKNRFFGGTLQANADAFYWNYHNHQEIYLTQSQADPSVTLPQTHNIGAATDKGATLDVIWRPTTDDTFGAQIEYLDAVFNQFTFDEYTTTGFRPNTGCSSRVIGHTVIANQSDALNLVDCSGKPFTRAPRWSANLSYQHVFELPADNGRVTARIASKISTSQYLAVDYLASEKEPALTTSDFSVTYEPSNAKWALIGYVRNLENTASYSGAFAYAFAYNVTLVDINPPRTFGGIFKYNF